MCGPTPHKTQANINKGLSVAAVGTQLDPPEPTNDTKQAAADVS